MSRRFFPPSQESVNGHDPQRDGGSLVFRVLDDFLDRRRDGLAIRGVGAHDCLERCQVRPVGVAGAMRQSSRLLAMGKVRLDGFGQLGFCGCQQVTRRLIPRHPAPLHSHGKSTAKPRAGYATPGWSPLAHAAHAGRMAYKHQLCSHELLRRSPATRARQWPITIDYAAPSCTLPFEHLVRERCSIMADYGKSSLTTRLVRPERALSSHASHSPGPSEASSMESWPRTFDMQLSGFSTTWRSQNLTTR